MTQPLQGSPQSSGTEINTNDGTTASTLQPGDKAEEEPRPAPSTTRQADSNGHDHRSAASTGFKHHSSSSSGTRILGSGRRSPGFFAAALRRLKSWLHLSPSRKGRDEELRQVLEDYLEEPGADSQDEMGEEEAPSIAVHERALISNVLKLRDLACLDVMIPRADIDSISVNTPPEEVLRILSRVHHSRLPVTGESLDDIIGILHIKDVLEALAEGKELDISRLARDVQIISPAMHVLDLLLEMRGSRKHLALVVDEYGGIDGLVTIGDIIEAIVGELEDEHDLEPQPQFVAKGANLWLADARLPLEELEEETGTSLEDEVKEEADTLGGLVVMTAGRVPGRGEIIKAPNLGLQFDILDADPRRVHRVRIRRVEAEYFA